MTETTTHTMWRNPRDTDPGEERQDLLMAAALAAAMVEYRHYKRVRTEAGNPARGDNGWRTVARVERLARRSQGSRREST
jgi:hypothetical protein